MFKRKASNYERELQKKLWEFGFACFRIAGSGSSSFPATDLIAIKDGRVLAFEVKTTKKDKIYLDRGQLEELKRIKEYGILVYVAVKFIGKGWYIFDLDKVLSDNKITLERAQSEGIKLLDFLNGQTKIIEKYQFKSYSQ